MITHYWAPHVGGIETIGREQARRLADLGWHIEVFTSRLGDDPEVMLDGKITVHRYRCVNWQERGLSLPVPVPSPRMLTDLIRYARTADLILAHGHCYPGSVFGAVAANVADRPLVVVQSNPFVDYPFPLAAIERAVDRTVGRWVLQRARLVICVSKRVGAFVRLIAPHASTEVIYSGVEIERFTPAGPAEPGAGSEPRGAGSGLRVLTLRRLVPRNGVDVLVEAWRKAALGEKAVLTIAGTGPEQARLERLAAGLPSVTFAGRVPDADLPGLYRAADLFVLPSVSGEGFGIAAAEALASGVPVIATDGGATGELVSHGRDGLIVPAGDSAALAEAITRLERDRGLLSDLATAARARGPELCWNVSIDRLERTLDALITRQAQGGAIVRAAKS